MANSKKSPEKLSTPSEVENISKIRDILFGNNMSEYEQRFEQLEDKLAKAIAESRSDADKKIASLETLLKKEFKLLNDKVLEEEESRIKSDKKLMAEIESLESSLGKFKQQTSENFADVNQQIHQLNLELNEQLNQLKNTLQERMDASTSQLQNNKMDRSALAMMLNDLAYKIAGEQDESSNNS